MASFPLIHYAFDEDGKLRLCIPKELWDALRSAALSDEDVEVIGGFAQVPLREITESKIRSISMIPRDEEPPCRPPGK